MGAAEQHQNIARMEWDELRFVLEYGDLVEILFARKCHKSTGNAIGSDRKEGVLLLPLLTSKRKGVKLNASLAHSERISALAEVEKEREAVNQLSGLGLLASKGCFGKAYEHLSFDGRSVVWYGIKSNPSCLVNKQRDQVRTELRMTELSSLPLAGLLAKTDPPPTTLYGLVSEATEYSYLLCSVDSSAHSAYDSYPIASSCSLSAGVKDGSSSSSALLAASSQLSSKRWFARAIVRISSTMSTESSTRNHFFDILEKIKQFRSMPIADHVVNFPMESEGAVDGRGITGLFGSMVGKPSSFERIDRQAALHAVTIEEIRVEISESLPLRPYISSLSLAKKVRQLKVTCWPCIIFPNDGLSDLIRILIKESKTSSSMGIL
ncbi:hypothetical protein Tco_1555694 [Tanacetum coccineum]